MKKINFLAIGDLATDAFIKIKEAEMKCDPQGEKCELCLNFGGKIPYDFVEICNATGNAANVAVCVNKLGLNSSILSYLGDDEIAKDSIKYLKKQKINISNIKKIKGMNSNYHYVLWYGTERTILVKHTPFPYSFPSKIKEPDWIYLSSLASNSEKYEDKIFNYLNKHPKVNLAFQPGTYQIKQGVKELENIYRRTNIFLCNHEEAQKILNIENKDIPFLLKEINKLGPKIVVITNGMNGAYAYDGKDMWYIKALPHMPYESTGAGDSFSGSFVTAMILGKGLSEALLWGAINAMSVVSKIGPQKGLMTRHQIEEYIKNIADDYKAKKYNYEF